MNVLDLISRSNVWIEYIEECIGEYVANDEWLDRRYYCQHMGSFMWPLDWRGISTFDLGPFWRSNSMSWALRRRISLRWRKMNQALLLSSNITCHVGFLLTYLDLTLVYSEKVNLAAGTVRRELLFVFLFTLWHRSLYVNLYWYIFLNCSWRQ